jgi:hypothetical protein
MSRFKRKKRGVSLRTIEREVLENLSAGDMFAGFLCSAMSTKKMYETAHARAKKRYLVRLATERLVAEGLIDASGEVLSLSVSGRELLKKVTLARRMLAEATWDGKWRIVIFDIPQNLAPLRGEIRSILKRAGFYMLQQSVWVFPHDCQELTDLIKRDARLHGRVLYGVLESIEGDSQLRRAFKLA